MLNNNYLCYRALLLIGLIDLPCSILLPYMALHAADRTGSCFWDYDSQRHVDAATHGIGADSVDSTRRTNSPGRCN